MGALAWCVDDDVEADAFTFELSVSDNGLQLPVGTGMLAAPQCCLSNAPEPRKRKKREENLQMLGKTMVGLFCVFCVLAVTAVPASAITRGGPPFDIEDPDSGQRWGCRYIDNTTFICIPLNGPGAMVDIYTVVPSGAGAWAVHLTPGEQGTPAGAMNLQRVLTASPSRVPAANSPGGRMAPRSPIHGRANSRCVHGLVLTIGDGTSSSDEVATSGTLYVDWGNGQTTSHGVVDGEVVYLSRQYTSGAGALFSEYLGPRFYRFHHKITYRVVDEYGDEFYGGSFMAHDQGV